MSRTKANRAVQHPATTKLFQRAAVRFMKLRDQHTRACRLMWAGTLASHFTATELRLLAAYLCPDDYALLKAVKRADS